jgi:hypothetical protein
MQIQDVQKEIRRAFSGFEYRFKGNGMVLSRFAGCARYIGIAFVAIVILLVIYRLLVLPWMNTWGATAEEIRAPLPGDELVANPVAQTTQAVTIRARPEQIYPWLLQLGVDRGGMYSYDWIENLFGLNVHTIDYIDPQYQNVQPGDFWGFTPKSSGDGPGVWVIKLDPNRAVIGCFGMRSTPPAPCTGTWQLILQSQSDGTTRLILRARTDAASPMTGVMGTVFDPITFIMQRGMLLGFRDRIQAASQSQPDTPPSMVPPVLSWSEAKQMILDGKVKQVMQAHSLQVTLTLNDGSICTTIEPQIDEVMRVVKECGARCQDVLLVTE